MSNAMADGLQKGRVVEVGGAPLRVLDVAASPCDGRLLASTERVDGSAYCLVVQRPGGEPFVHVTRPRTVIGVRAYPFSLSEYLGADRERQERAFRHCQVRQVSGDWVVLTSRHLDYLPGERELFRSPRQVGRLYLSDGESELARIEALEFAHAYEARCDADERRREIREDIDEELRVERAHAMSEGA